MEIAAIILLVITGIIVCLNIYAIARSNVTLVGKFLIPLRIIHTTNILWQIASAVKYHLPDDFGPAQANIVQNAVSAANMAANCIFHLMVLEAFQVLTKIPTIYVTIAKVWMLVWMVISTVVCAVADLTGNEMAVKLNSLILLVMASSAMCANNVKSIYLLRLLYLDKLRIEKNNANKIVTDTKYKTLRNTFLIIFAWNMSTIALWQIGTMRNNDTTLIHLSVILTGIEILYYTNLICAFRDIRFDQQSSKKSTNQKKSVPRNSETNKLSS